MAIVTQSAQSQSNAAINGQSTTYLKGLVLQQCPGAPDSLVDTQIQLVLRDFYTKSNAWRVTLGPFNVTTGIDTVQLNPVDAYSSVLNVFRAYFYPFPDANSVTPKFLSSSPLALVGGQPSQPNFFWMYTPDTLVLYPKPEKVYGRILYAQVSLKPVINSTQLPPIATEQHLDALVSGVLARLYAMPNKPFTAKDQAAVMARTYTREMLIARDHARRQYGSADTPMPFPRFAGRGSQRLYWGG